MAASLLENIPDEVKSLYQKHFNTIKTRVTRGRIKTIYHFLVTNHYDIKKYISRIKADQNGKVKLNVALGFILKNIESNELRFFHPSYNSTIFHQPQTLETEEDYKILMDDLERKDVLDFASSERPSTKWRVAKIVCVRFDVYKLSSPQN